MSKYTMTKVQDNGCTFYAIYSEDEMKYFAGYDFMGSIDWVQNLNDAYWMSDDEAYQIMADLKDSDDEPDDGLTDEDRKIKTSYPDWLCFPGIYHSEDATSACFFDLESLLADMKRYLGYDNEHCEIVRKAMMAYAGQN